MSSNGIFGKCNSNAIFYRHYRKCLVGRGGVCVTFVYICYEIVQNVLQLWEQLYTIYFLISQTQILSFLKSIINYLVFYIWTLIAAALKISKIIILHLWTLVRVHDALFYCAWRKIRNVLHLNPRNPVALQWKAKTTSKIKTFYRSWNTLQKVNTNYMYWSLYQNRL